MYLAVFFICLYMLSLFIYLFIWLFISLFIYLFVLFYGSVTFTVGIFCLFHGSTKFNKYETIKTHCKKEKLVYHEK